MMLHRNSSETIARTNLDQSQLRLKQRALSRAETFVNEAVNRVISDEVFRGSREPDFDALLEEVIAKVDQEVIARTAREIENMKAESELDLLVIDILKNFFKQTVDATINKKSTLIKLRDAWRKVSSAKTPRQSTSPFLPGTVHDS